MAFSFERPAPQTLEQRIANALEVRQKFSVPDEVALMVDSMDNAFNSALCAWPTCLYVADNNGSLLHVWQGEEGGASCNVNTLFSWIRKRLQN